MGVCSHCGQSLARAKYQAGKDFKSCPRCSQESGEHIFYPCPGEFGTTRHRVSKNSPEGIQSYCTSCRGGRFGPHDGGLRCSEFK